MKKEGEKGAGPQAAREKNLMPAHCLAQKRDEKKKGQVGGQDR